MRIKYVLLCLAICWGNTWASATNKLRVVVDERMELLTIIQYLSDYPVLTSADLTYKNDIDAYFKPFRKHNAVQLNRQIYRRFFGFDAPSDYLYHFSFPDFKQIAPFSDDDSKIFGFNDNKDTLALLLKEFKNFYEESHFHAFYLQHKKFYDSLIVPVRNRIEKTNIVSIMESHYGRKNAAYYVVLSPLLHDGGYGPQIKRRDGEIIYAIIGPTSDSKRFPQFDAENILGEYVVHEFSHSFCNPIIYKYYPKLEKDSSLLQPIRASQKSQGYGSWDACLCEHLVRANEIVLTEIIQGKAKADDLYKDYVDNLKWIYLKGLVPIVREQYVRDRARYKTLDDLMPPVIAYFDQEAKSRQGSAVTK